MEAKLKKKKVFTSLPGENKKWQKLRMARLEKQDKELQNFCEEINLRK